VFASLRDGSCRKLWDKDLFDYQEWNEIIDAHTFLLYVRAKGQVLLFLFFFLLLLLLF